jgi:hypothetical protein
MVIEYPFHAVPPPKNSSFDAVTGIGIYQETTALALNILLAVTYERAEVLKPNLLLNSLFSLALIVPVTVNK